MSVSLGKDNDKVFHRCGPAMQKRLLLKPVSCIPGGLVHKQ